MQAERTIFETRDIPESVRVANQFADCPLSEREALAESLATYMSLEQQHGWFDIFDIIEAFPDELRALIKGHANIVVAAKLMEMHS